jgi:hypothetical protein
MSLGQKDAKIFDQIGLPSDLLGRVALSKRDSRLPANRATDRCLCSLPGLASRVAENALYK